MTMTDEDKRLSKAFEFAPDDLAANRQGKKSESQIAQLKDKSQVELILKGAGTLVGLPFVLLLSSAISVNPIGLCILFVVVMAGWMWIGSTKYKRDIEQNAAQKICGEISLDITPNITPRYSVSYELHIEKLTFRVDSDRFLALKNRDRYCIYYTPNVRHILSIETFTEAKNTLSQQRFGEHAQNYVTSQTHAKGADLDRLLELAQPRPYSRPT